MSTPTVDLAFQYSCGRQCTSRGENQCHAPSVGTDVRTFMLSSAALRLTTGALKYTRIGMPTPMTVSRSGDTAGKTCALAVTVVNVLDAVVSLPAASVAAAVTRYVVPKASLPVEVQVVLAPSSLP